LGCGADEATAIAPSPPPMLQPALPLPEDEDPFLWQFETAIFKGSSGRLELKLQVPPGTHLYRDQLSVTPSLDTPENTVAAFGTPDFPPGELEPDPAGGPPREIYNGDVILYVPVQVDGPGLWTAVLETTHQGCKPGLCFPPKQQTLSVLVRSTP